MASRNSGKKEFIAGFEQRTPENGFTASGDDHASQTRNQRAETAETHCKRQASYVSGQTDFLEERFAQGNLHDERRHTNGTVKNRKEPDELSTPLIQG